jgi:hypothetical protein
MQVKILLAGILENNKEIFADTIIKINTLLYYMTCIKRRWPYRPIINDSSNNSANNNTSP